MRLVLIPILIICCLSLVIPVAANSYYEYNGTYYREYTSPGNMTWTIPNGITSINYIIVAGGGGGGGYYYGGGGGGGGVLYDTLNVVDGEIINISVGGGGDGAYGTAGGTGQNSSINNIVANGGGGGANVWYSATSGGSGGGGSGYGFGPGSGTIGQGNIGGLGTDPQSGGGGGADEIGYNYNDPVCPSCGGDGIPLVINGTTRYFGGGGGGNGYNITTQGLGGLGGGGHGAVDGVAIAVAGTAQTGGGGGGACHAYDEPVGYGGGSGIVIISYTFAPVVSGGATPLIVQGNNGITWASPFILAGAGLGLIITGIRKRKGDT